MEENNEELADFSLRHIEEMSLPCPEDICDGSGTVVDEEGVDRTCPHVLEDDRYDPDRDY